MEKLSHCALHAQLFRLLRLMMEEDHQVEIKQLYNISFDKGKECQIPEKLVVEDRVVVQMSIAFLKSMV